MSVEVAEERLHRDIRHAEVYAPHVHQRPVAARVFVTDRRVLVYSADEHHTVRVFLDEPLVGDPPQRSRASLVGQLHLATEGGTVHVSRGRGCGCGSPLRSVRPPVGW